MTAVNYMAKNESKVRVCSVRYLSPQANSAPEMGPVVLFAVQSRLGLRLYTHPGLKQQVSEDDRDYMEEILRDFETRAQESPEDLFDQLSQLSIGPLVTDAVRWYSERSAVDHVRAEARLSCNKPVSSSYISA